MTVEQHPFVPFLPENARLLMLGTFPPAEKRWAMKFYYPNFTNDMWRIMGLCFYGDKMHFVNEAAKTYDLNGIIAFLNQNGIAMYDTATRVIRTKNTASDKDLEIVEETDLKDMLRHLPLCRAVLTAGQLATTIASRQFGIAEPKVGTFEEFTLDERQLRLYRMPSSSRAYPMKVEQKAGFYYQMLDEIVNCK